MLCKRGLCCHAMSICPSVCLYVTFVCSVETTKHNFKRFSRSGSHTILVFPYQTSWQYSDGNPPPLTGGVKCRWGRQKSRFWANITAPSRAVNAATASCYQHGAAGSWQVTLIAGSKRRSLLMAGDDDEMFMTRNLNVMPKTKEQHLIVCSDKSVA